MSSTAYTAASVIIPNSAGVKAGTLQGWRPDVNLLQNIDVLRPATTNVASYVNKAGVRVFVAANVPRWDWSEGLSCPSLLVEPQRTNLFDQDLAGAGIATQTVTVVSGTEYSVSVEGSGSMTLSGAGTGPVTEGSHVTFTASTTSLTLTLTGALDYCQVEAGAYPSSIIYTSGGTATRNEDQIFKSGISSLIGHNEGTLYFETLAFNISEGNFVSFSDGSNSNRLQIGFNVNSKVTFAVTVGGDDQVIKNSASAYTSDVFYKIAVKYSPNNFKVYLNGAEISSQSSGATFPSAVLSLFRIGDPNNNPSWHGRFKNITWWKTGLINSELATLTTP